MVKDSSEKQFAQDNLNGIHSTLANVAKQNGHLKAPLTDIALIAAQHLVNLLDVLPPPPIAMKILSNGEEITLFTKGNFSIVTGFAKSRKSFLISMLLATSIALDGLLSIFRCCGTGVNILFDTEQSKYKVQQIIEAYLRLMWYTFP